MRTLIFGTTYVADQGKLWLAHQWVRLNKKLNPNMDLLLIDSASPVPLPQDVEVFNLGNNIGHAWELAGKHPTCGDGWGRAFCCGLQFATSMRISRFNGIKYDHVVCMESDLLCKVPMQPYIDRLVASGKGIAAPTATPKEFLEVGLMVMDVEWLRAFKLAEKYDWRNAGIIPEERIENMVKPDLLYLNDCLRGGRMGDFENHGAKVDVRKFDYMTHGTIPQFNMFLEGTD